MTLKLKTFKLPKKFYYIETSKRKRTGDTSNLGISIQGTDDPLSEDT